MEKVLHTKIFINFSLIFSEKILILFSIFLFILNSLIPDLDSTKTISMYIPTRINNVIAKLNP